MADRIFLGHGTPTSEVHTFTVGGTIETTDEFKVTINSKTLTVVAGSTVAATVAATIHAALAAATHPEFTELDWTVDSAVITGTVKSAYAGRPITITSTTVETGGGAADAQTFVQANPTPNDGPHIIKAANFSGAALPAAGDTIFFQELTDVDLKYLLTALSGVGTIARIVQPASFESRIGLPRHNNDQLTPYSEYRPKTFRVDCSKLEIGYGSGRGSPRSIYDLGAVASEIEVWKTAASDDRGYHALRLYGTNANNALIVHGGEVDIAPDADQASTFATIRLAGAGKVRTGPKVTLGTVLCGGGGIFECNHRVGNMTRLEVSNNAIANFYGVRTDGSNGNVTDVAVLKGVLNWLGGVHILGAGGGKSAIVVRNGGTFDASNCPQACTISGPVELHEGCTWLDPNQRITYGGTPQFVVRGRLEKMTLDFGQRFDMSITTISIDP